MTDVPDRAALQAALEVANLPTLLVVLAHLTGDDAWLAEPYRPSRTIALDDNDDAGLPSEIGAEIRAVALDVLDELRTGRRELPAPPSDERLVAMLSVSMGEEVPPEYGPSMAEDSGFRELPWQRRQPLDGGPRVLVIGAGLFGIAMAAALRRLGVPYTQVEKADDVGGTWLRNTYPGAGVDTPCHLYSYSFAARSDWSRHFAKQPEILAHVRETAHRHDLLDAIRFGTEVVAARWDDTTSTWHVRLRGADGHEETHVADVVVSATGLFGAPVLPDVEGIGTFPGPVVHTSAWPRDLDLRGKRVGVVGTGATSMQVVPAIVDDAAQTVVFQRSPQWVVPNGNYLRPMDDRLRLLMEHVPGYRGFYRARLMWQYQDKLQATLHKDPSWPHPERSLNATNDRHRRFLTAHLDAQLAGGGEHLRDGVLPTYPPYGKRILIDNGWFATLRRPDVELVASAVTGIDGATVVTADGGRHDVDVLVFATGYDTHRPMHPVEVRGRTGTLREQWGDDDARAHLGLTVPGFPNLFLLYGPHTNSGHGGSAIFVGECQVNYVVEMLARMHEQGIAAVDVRPEVCDAYNDRLDTAHEQMIWTHPGMTTYYRNAAGRVVTTMPWRLVDYWAMTRTPDLDEFETRYAASARSASVFQNISS